MTITTSSGRRRVAVRRALLAATTTLAAGTINPAMAQMAAPAPVHQSVDANGVDLFTGALYADAPGMSMGQGDQGLGYHQLNRGSGWTDSITAALNQSGNIVTVGLGGTTDQFTASGSTYIATQGNGAILTYSSGTYTYTRADGTVVHFSASRSSDTPYYASLGRVTDIIQPSGTKLVYAYDGLPYCSRSKAGSDGNICTGHSTAFRVSSVTSSYGYRLSFNYPDVDTGDSNDPDGFADLGAWSTPHGVTETNVAQGSASQSESFGYSGSAGTTNYNVTDPMGRVTSYRLNGNQIAGVTRPGSSAEDATIAYNGERVSSVATPAGTWSYASSDANGARTVTVTDPASQDTSYVFDLGSALMTRMTDALGNVSQWQYDGNGRVTLATAPEGNSVQYGYDGRGNVISVVMHAKPGSGQADITTSAAYPVNCFNAVTCNKPTSTTDARGNTSTYAYDPTHGGVTVMTAPAGANGVHPEMRYGYTAFTDYLNSTIYRQTSSSTCRTQASCSGSSDEVVGATAYGSMAANNLLPVSTSTGAGDGSLTASTSIGYDGVGNALTSTDPLGNVTAYRYDADREMVGMVGPDPDGSGGNWNPAARMTYDPRGRVTLLEQGTAPGQSNGDWSNFSSHHQVATGYDVAGRKTQEATQNNGGTSALVQYSYDGAGRLDCTALRMNPGTYNSLPGACDLGAQGGFGPDRINRYEYDALSRINKTWSGYRTGDAAASLTSYTPDGKTQSVTDANGNVTSYIYDGFGRLSQIHYPNQSGGGSSTYDSANLEYDAAGNVTRRWLRGTGNHQDYGYDALNRLISVSVPGLNASDHGASYAYDNLAELTSANEDNNSFVTVGYDALGRKTSEGSKFGGTKTFGYDLAGRRTRVTWQDGFFVTYGYDNAGHMTAASDNTGAQLFYLSYDDDGRRTALCPNGTGGNQAMCTRYGYDAAGRLSAQDLMGTNGANLTFGGYNPAGQIGQRQNSNDAYAITGAGNVNKGYAVNGLNQYTSVAGAAIGYDQHGNLTSQNGKSYSYDSFNRLGEFNGGQSQGNWLYYDAVGRLNWSNASQTRFDYDGAQLLSELDGNGNIARRYVYGPNPDEPVVWYEGSGTGDKRFLTADERGSIMRVQQADGSTLATNSYDEYGVPAASNQGRFGYTGQTWLPELGFWYYKARMYAPSLGRFLQTDPIGYADGINWYNYAGSDPINARDPSGTLVDIVVTAPSRGGSSGGGFNFGLISGLSFPAVNFGLLASDDDESNDVVVTARRGRKPMPKPAPSVSANVQLIPINFMPQNNQQPARPSRTQCSLTALNNNKLSLALDAGAAALTFLAPEASVAASIAGSALGVIGIGNAIANKDATGAGIAYAGKQAAVGGGFVAAGSNAARIVGRLNVGVLAASVLYDSAAVARDYNKCMAGQ